MGFSARISDLMQEATSRTGLDDYGRDSWKEGLEVLLRSADTEGTFNDYGRQAFHEGLVRILVNRLNIEDWYHRHPEIDEQDVSVELLGVGFPRTGSTALSHMIAEDDAFRILRLWEEGDPCPPPGLSPEADQARIEAAQGMVGAGQYMDPRLRSMLPHSPTGPMEDHDMMALEFKAQFFLVQAHIPEYGEWFINCDMEPTYLYERRVLKLLQWKTPEKVWRLKSPTHSFFLPAYTRVFPDARFVQTHRDPSKVLASVSDLYYTMLQPGNEVDPLYVGELNLHQWGQALDRVAEFREVPENDAKFFDIGFTQFQADPLSEIRKLYEWLGDQLSDATVDRMLAWRGDNPKDKYGKHEYAGALFGLTDEALAARFSSYRSRFAEYL
jgi:hypothetical protein